MQLRALPILVLLLGCAWLAPAHAQIKSATITGIVTDTAGATIAGATVAVINEETTVRQTVVTNSDGDYTVPYLAAGRYTVEVSRQGSIFISGSALRSARMRRCA